MKRNKLFVFFSILIMLLLFGSAAVCNMCGLKIAPTTSTDTSTGAGSETETLADASSGTAKDTAGSSAKDTKAEETSKESATEETDKTADTSEKPTIKLEIYEGPTFSSADSICFYRVKAILTGSPTPNVEFSKDESNGSLGSNKAQINLSKTLQSYTLTAQAVNSAGAANASIDISWGCPPLNSSPEISQIIIATPVKTGTAYDVTATVSDPDGDSLAYAWTATGGILQGDTSSTLKWATPLDAGTYVISLKVTDGKGGEDTSSINVDVAKSSVNANLAKVLNEIGCIRSDQQVFGGWQFGVGDDNFNKSYRGFVSFDISVLPGATIQNAVLTLNKSNGWDPSHLGELWIGVVDYGAHPLIAQDYNLSGIAIQSFPAGSSASITCNPAILKTQIQNAINAGKERFQIRLHFSVPTDNDGAMDYWMYEDAGVNLNITYLPK